MIVGNLHADKSMVRGYFPLTLNDFFGLNIIDRSIDRSIDLSLG